MIPNLIARERTKQPNDAMKIFKTSEELVDYVCKQENIEFLESGEIILKEWNDDARALEKLKKDHGLVTSDRKSLRSKNEELSKEVTELKERLTSVGNELSELKEVHSGNDKDAVQKLIKEKSDLQTKYNAIEAEYKDMKTTIPELEKRIENYKEASNRSRILEAARKAAVQRKVPQNIIDDPDFETIVVNACTVDDMGNIFTKGDDPQTIDNYIVAKQKDRTHWMPTSQGGTGNDPIRPSSNGEMVSDEIAAIAALFG
jgi:seryl-tRNA synthetase